MTYKEIYLDFNNNKVHVSENGIKTYSYVYPIISLVSKYTPNQIAWNLKLLYDYSNMISIDDDDDDDEDTVDDEYIDIDDD